jgi:hypothetical protein
MEVYEKIKSKYPDAIMEYEINNKITSDIFVPEINTIIECYGDYWHGNPKKYQPDYFHKNCRMSIRDIWEKDHDREVIIQETHKLQIIWESDWKTKKEINI